LSGITLSSCKWVPWEPVAESDIAKQLWARPLDGFGWDSPVRFTELECVPQELVSYSLNRDFDFQGITQHGMMAWMVSHAHRAGHAKHHATVLRRLSASAARFRRAQWHRSVTQGKSRLSAHQHTL